MIPLMFIYVHTSRTVCLSVLVFEHPRWGRVKIRGLLWNQSRQLLTVTCCGTCLCLCISSITWITSSYWLWVGTIPIAYSHTTIRACGPVAPVCETTINRRQTCHGTVRRQSGFSTRHTNNIPKYYILNTCYRSTPLLNQPSEGLVIKEILWDFFIFTLEQIIVLNKY